jgi:hypothetical protein
LISNMAVLRPAQDGHVADQNWEQAINCGLFT